MKTNRKRALRRAGFQVGSIRELLGLSDADVASIKMRISPVAKTANRDTPGREGAARSAWPVGSHLTVDSRRLFN